MGTNSISIPQERVFPQLKVLSVANLIWAAIWRILEESSVSSMFRCLLASGHGLLNERAWIGLISIDSGHP